MTELKEKLYKIFNIINSDRNIEIYCNQRTLDAIAELKEIIYNRDLIVGSKKTLINKLVVDGVFKNDDFTTFKTGIYYNELIPTEQVKLYEKEIKEVIKEIFVSDLENKFLNEWSKEDEKE